MRWFWIERRVEPKGAKGVPPTTVVLVQPTPAGDIVSPVSAPATLFTGSDVVVVEGVMKLSMYCGFLPALPLHFHHYHSSIEPYSAWPSRYERRKANQPRATNQAWTSTTRMRCVS